MKKISSILLILLLSLSSAEVSAESRVRSIELRKIISSFSKSQSLPNHDSYVAIKKIIGPLRQIPREDLDKFGSESFPDLNGSSDYYYIFYGRLNILVNGKALVRDRLNEEHSFAVWVAGSKHGVDKIWLSSDNSSADNIEIEKYLETSGIRKTKIACAKIDAGNWTKYFLLHTKIGKYLSLQISKSSGSGGAWYGFEFSWTGLKASELVDDARIGICDVN